MLVLMVLLMMMVVVVLYAGGPREGTHSEADVRPALVAGYSKFI